MDSTTIRMNGIATVFFHGSETPVSFSSQARVIQATPIRLSMESLDDQRSASL
jgi:hypothetical protein